VSPVDVRRLVLCTEIADDWAAVERHLERAQTVDPAAGWAAEALVAMSLDHAYEGFEQILLRVERELGLPARSGASWHRAALDLATRDLPGVRPAILDGAAHAAWGHLLRFRHFFRHAYNADLSADELRANRDRLAAAVQHTRPGLQRLLDALRA
jgi:hypothetical protein